MLASGKVPPGGSVSRAKDGTNARRDATAGRGERYRRARTRFASDRNVSGGRLHRRGRRARVSRDAHRTTNARLEVVCRGRLKTTLAITTQDSYTVNCRPAYFSPEEPRPPAHFRPRKKPRRDPHFGAHPRSRIATMGGPFKMPSSAEAEEDKRRKVSGSAAPPQFLERPSALIQNPRYAPRHGR